MPQGDLVWPGRLKAAAHRRVRRKSRYELSSLDPEAILDLEREMETQVFYSDDVLDPEDSPEGPELGKRWIDGQDY